MPVKDGEKDVAAGRRGRAQPPRTMREKQINSSRQPCDRDPHSVIAGQSLSGWSLRRTHTHAKHRSILKSCLKRNMFSKKRKVKIILKNCRHCRLLNHAVMIMQLGHCSTIGSPLSDVM